MGRPEKSGTENRSNRHAPRGHETEKPKTILHTLMALEVSLSLGMFFDDREVADLG
jgi:hypothetical protein